jgi:ATP-dependent Clp protease ATP-binding subunit ClpA
MEELKKRMAERNISLSYSLVVSFLAEKSFDQKSGARKIRRLISDFVEDAIANELLNLDQPEGVEVHLEAKKSSIKISVHTF